MTGILPNAGIAGPLQDNYNFNDVGLPLKSLYGILQDKFKELAFSKPYCIEVGPLPLFLRKKVICKCLSNAEKPIKEKVGKEKAGKFEAQWLWRNLLFISWDSSQMWS
ncbi:hypothetical protein BT96DRAFT_947367 [Gymnopus androsaceus JB14]|uniref:Uncharacterized protein n=1 Tax=Gymnopus androsaceus JB14 TaxID=1447944 RepID=A0A6A4GUH4_9AGAR|nr:hypothetical protein BT96DRAFT_947367 [Gymnopus androsaceus JB14]